MGRPAMTEQRRIEIGRALQSCLIRSGSYTNTSVKDIAAEAGIAAGLVHHYFESKDEILMLTVDMALQSAENSINDILNEKDAEERKILVSELINDKDLCRFFMIIYHRSLSMPEVKARILESERNMIHSIAVRLKRSERHSLDAEQTAKMLINYFLGEILMSAVHDDYSADNLFAMIARIF